MEVAFPFELSYTANSFLYNIEHASSVQDQLDPDCYKQ